MKFHSALAVALAALFGSSPSYGLSIKECSDAHFEAQVARSEGRLLDAENLLSACGDATCPGVLVSECGEWLQEVSATIPSIVIVAQDAQGQDVLNYKLVIDDAPHELGQSSSVALDPGTHEILVTAEGYKPRREVIRLRESEKYRKVTLLLESTRPEAEPRASGPELWPLLLSGGLAVAAGATFAVMGLDARASERELRACRPECSDTQVKQVRLKYVVANTALGLGIASLLGGGLYLTLFDSGSDEDSDPAQPGTTASHLEWSLKLGTAQPGLLLDGRF